jgi:hypothetical protein
VSLALLRIRPTHLARGLDESLRVFMRRPIAKWAFAIAPRNLCPTSCGMNRFAELLDRLAFEPSRNAKIALIVEYFRSEPDPERGYALAAMTGALSFQLAKPGLIRALIGERTDPVLFAYS